MGTVAGYMSGDVYLMQPTGVKTGDIHRYGMVLSSYPPVYQTLHISSLTCTLFSSSMSCCYIYIASLVSFLSYHSRHLSTTVRHLFILSGFFHLLPFILLPFFFFPSIISFSIFILFCISSSNIISFSPILPRGQ